MIKYLSYAKFIIPISVGAALAFYKFSESYNMTLLDDERSSDRSAQLVKTRTRRSTASGPNPASLKKAKLRLPDVGTTAEALSAAAVTPASALAQRLALAEQQITQLVNRLDAMVDVQQQPSGALTIAGQPVTAASDQADAPQASDIADQQGSDSTAKRANDMELFMAQQEADPQWETRAVEQITNRFATGDTSSPIIDSIACRGRVCRIELSYEDPQTLDTLVGGTSLMKESHQGFLHQIDASRSIFYIHSQEG